MVVVGAVLGPAAAARRPVEFAVLLLAAVAGGVAGPSVRAAIFRHSVPGRDAFRSRCPRCAAALAVGTRVPGAWPRKGRGPAAAVVPRRWWRAPGPGRLPASGRAPCCGVRIGPPAASVEAVSALACALVVAARPGPAAVAGCWIAVCGIALVAVDAAVHRLPGPLTVATTAGSGFALVPTAWVDPAGVARAVAAAAAATGVLLLVRAATRGGLGGGDCTLAPALGATAGRDGWPALLLAGLVGAVLGALHALVVAARTGRVRGVEVPFGPALVVGVLAVVTAVGPPG
ncbi:peptidase A24A prepilin type IV [Pseudonocardia dioxanivorans CB1190]|uniref:Peptidase A24A prepilin type IV n=1 Tax=Pseudonocardia dioxanivorans (strain ATCC 55486 / DSM 44775 / JCM 13855 / CB1190) TaxID=675635 RepID=F4D055_PSEUX|nr:peptidase A24A prepilin type IV [Pseudonocardia dioxanivorans CB1190]